MFKRLRLLSPIRLCLAALSIQLLLAAVPAWAQRMVFHNIFQNNKNVEHQLSGINHIVQDSQGFMWFGSEKGLARYDGGETRIYRHQPGDPHSIVHDFIRGLAIDRTDTLWVATAAGVCSYLAELDRFACGNVHYPGEWPTEPVRAIALDHNDQLFIGTAIGLYQVSADRLSINRIPLTLVADDGSAGVTALVVDRSNTLWIGTENYGLLARNAETAGLTGFAADAQQPEGLVHNRISALGLDAEERLWIGTYGGGLSVLNAERNAFTNHRRDLSHAHGLSSNIIWEIFTDSLGTVWLAVDQGGLVRYDPEVGFVANRHKPYDRTSLTSDQVRVIYEDGNGDLWLGAFPSGVSFYNRSTGRVKTYKHEPGNPESISHSAILTIHQDPAGHLWLGTEDGLNLFDPQTEQFTRYQFGSSELTARAVLSIEQFDDKTLWVGTWAGGLLAFDLPSRTFRPLDIGSLSGTGRSSMFIWDIMRDRQGNMWIGTELEGAGRYDRSRHQIDFYSRDLSRADALADNFVWSVIEDRNGDVWIATNAGLAVVSAQDGKLRRIERDRSDPNGLQSDRIMALYEDGRGRIWIGTQDNGVFIHHSHGSGFQHLGEAQGLPTGMSAGFIEDLQGNLWLLSTNGLVKIHPDTLSLQVFGTENGLAGNSFNRDAAFRDTSGQLYIGGADGLSVFSPAEMGDDLREFPVWLTALRILNREIKPGVDGSPLTQAISTTRELTLDHRASMFSFDFAALDYRNAQDTRYAYRLEGFDGDWHDIGSSRSATYTNIPPGKYRFRVRASHGRGGWTESQPLLITITPAPWRSLWAYLCYAVALLTAGYFFTHYYRLRGNTRLYKALSATDALTGVANRVGITQAAKAMLAGSDAEPCCLMFVDIDHFKRINDTRGHDSGDRVLVEVAEVLRQCLRRSDLLGRWGGEEFVLVYNQVDRESGLCLAEKVRAAVADHVFDHGHAPLKVTLSLGCAFLQPGESFEVAVKRADRALYQAKAAGRNCVVMAEEDCQ